MRSAPLSTWSSRVISVPRVLSVFHFSVKVSPCSAHLYFVSRDPDTLLVSVLAEPVLVNSCGATEGRLETGPLEDDDHVQKCVVQAAADVLAELYGISSAGCPLRHGGCSLT